MEIYAFSDTHGNLFTLERPPASVKLLVCTGDFFPNCNWGDDQRKFQRAWFNTFNEYIGATPYEYMIYLADNRPMLWVAGNHDWQSLAELMPRHAVYDLNEGPRTILGKRFSGFRYVPRVSDRWQGEMDQSDFRPIVDKILAQNPDVLCTHAPPYGILDCNWGIRVLTDALMYREHSIKSHLFGHVHEFAGTHAEQNGIHFYNNAMSARVIEV